MSENEVVIHLNHVAAASKALATKLERGGCWPGEQTEAINEIQKALDEAKRKMRDHPR